MKIIQISDSHISPEKPARTAELEACIQQINAAEQQPDAVVHTGDISHDGLVEEFQIARELLNTLSVPYYVLVGNRDRREVLAEVFADGQHITKGMDFIQYSVEQFETRLICIDTASGVGNKGRICAARIGHLENMLAAGKSKPTALFLHHPPFEVNVAPDPFQFEEWTDAEALQALISQHDQICGIYCGHVHRQYETMIGSVQAHVATCIASDRRWDDARDCVYAHTLPSGVRDGVAPAASNDG